jgi:hypothetical protein
MSALICLVTMREDNPEHVHDNKSDIRFRNRISALPCEKEISVDVSIPAFLRRTKIQPIVYEQSE